MAGSSRQGGASRSGGAAAAGPQHEFAVGQKAQCVASFDGQLHPAEVLDVRVSPDGQKQYYVHFISLDKRLDEWAAADKLLPAPAGSLARLDSVPSLALPPEVLAQTDGQKITRRLKRRLEDSHQVPVHDDAEHHHAPKTAVEKEHAERNKVKNVQVRCGVLRAAEAAAAAAAWANKGRQGM